MPYTPSQNIDQRVRYAAFDWLSEQIDIHGDVLKREILAQGFLFKGQQIRLMGPQGIFKPRIMELPLTITSIINSRYEDQVFSEGFLHYKYRGTNPNHRDNAGLRELMRRNIPLIYFHQIVRSKYMAVWPVYIVYDNPEELTFRVAVDDATIFSTKTYSDVQNTVSDIARRKYITTTIRQRMHQRSFRERVLAAYREQCAFCRLKHAQLLDAAHIISDREPEGNPIINNGIALCKLHHAAFDKLFVGIRPDYVIEVRNDIMNEEDGPMLLHGLKGIHNKKIILPHSQTDWPDQQLLEKKYKKFRMAG